MRHYIGNRVHLVVIKCADILKTLRGKPGYMALDLTDGPSLHIWGSDPCNPALTLRNTSAGDICDFLNGFPEDVPITGAEIATDICGLIDTYPVGDPINT